MNWQLARRKDFIAKWGIGILHAIVAAAVKKMSWETNRKSPELKRTKMGPGQTFQRLSVRSFVKEKIEKQLITLRSTLTKKKTNPKSF